MLLLALACVAQVTSDEGQVVLLDGGMSTLGTGRTTAPLLAYSQVCPGYGWGSIGLYAYGLVGSCFDVTYSGVLSADATCVELSAEPFEVELTPKTWCALVQDHFSFAVVGPREATARPQDLETLYEKYLIPTDEGWPDDWHQPKGGVWRLFEGSPFRLYPGLFRTTDDAAVGWTYAFADARGDGVEAGWDPVQLFAVVEAAAGDDGAVVFHVQDEEWQLAQVLGVAASAPTKLEVVAAYLEDALTGDVLPIGARAVVRDGNGDLVWGTPVVWSLDDGKLAVGDDYLTLPGPDHVTLLDACVKPSENAGTHQAVLRATYGDLSDTVDLSWTVKSAGNDFLWQPSDACTEGTGPPDTTPTDPGTTATDGTGTGPTAEVLEFVAGGGCGCGGRRAPAGLGTLVLLAMARRSRSRR